MLGFGVRYDATGWMRTGYISIGLGQILNGIEALLPHNALVMVGIVRIITWILFIIGAIACVMFMTSARH